MFHLGNVDPPAVRWARCCPMKTMTILLSAGLLVALLPLATAEEACGRAGTTEAIKHPTRDDAYIYIDATNPSRLGEWVESNRAPGLQTIACVKFGIQHFRADTHTAGLP